MSGNFDLKKFLIENKLTRNSKLLESHVDTEGQLKDFKLPDLPPSGNPGFDEAFDELVYTGLDTYKLAYYEDSKHRLAHVLMQILNKLEWLERDLRSDPEASAATILNPTTSFDFALVETLQEANEDLKQAMTFVRVRAARLLATYERLVSRI